MHSKHEFEYLTRSKFHPFDLAVQKLDIHEGLFVSMENFFEKMFSFFSPMFAFKEHPENFFSREKALPDQMENN